MSYTYPADVAVGSDLTTIEIHHLLKTPSLIRKRLQDLMAHKFIADFLLPGRFQAVGGAILYETGETIFPSDSPEAIEPGGEYPRTVLTAGELAAAKVVKWGQDTPVTDEAVSRLGIDVVNRALRKLANGNVKHVDTAALSVIASKVTQTVSVSDTSGSEGEVPTGAWATDDAIVEGVVRVKAWADEENVGADFNFDTIVLKPSQFAKVASKLMTGGLLPREGGNALLTGVIPDYLGMSWVTSPYITWTNPVLMDRTQLGGMADENIESPGYTGLDGVQVKSMRKDETDSYLLRARRVTVPVVLEPKAAVKITDTGL